MRILTRILTKIFEDPPKSKLPRSSKILARPSKIFEDLQGSFVDFAKIFEDLPRILCGSCQDLQGSFADFYKTFADFSGVFLGSSRILCGSCQDLQGILRDLGMVFEDFNNVERYLCNTLYYLA